MEVMPSPQMLRRCAVSAASAASPEAANDWAAADMGSTFLSASISTLVVDQLVKTLTLEQRRTAAKDARRVSLNDLLRSAGELQQPQLGQIAAGLSASPSPPAHSIKVVQEAPAPISADCDGDGGTKEGARSEGEGEGEKQRSAPVLRWHKELCSYATFYSSDPPGAVATTSSASFTSTRYQRGFHATGALPRPGQAPPRPRRRTFLFDQSSLPHQGALTDKLNAHKVQLETVTIRAPHVFLTIRVANLDLAKKVVVRRSTDGWKSHTDDAARHVRSFDSTDQFLVSFSVKTHSEASDTEFCICYDVRGQSYWDNNAGNNYRIAAV